MRGTTLGQYRITGSIGHGGMGTVYSAEHTLLGRAAAVKILLPELSRDQEVVTRFFNEARAAAAIRHPSIVEIYDFGWHTDGSAYLVMEHLQGESLAARLARRQMPVTGALTVVRQIARALAAAHRIGIVHRDLKPENVFLVPDPEVAGGERIKLLDFGIAKLVAGNDEGRVTRPGVVLGTPTYMAPEQCQGAPVDHRADLYSLGCITFELCAARPPFVGDDVGEMLAAHVHEAPPALSSLVAGIPPALEALVHQLLVKELDGRVQSAEAVVQAIDAVTGFHSGGRAIIADPDVASGGRRIPTFSGPPSAVVPPQPAAGSRRRWMIGLGSLFAIAAMLTATAIGARMRRRGDASAPAAAVVAALDAGGLDALGAMVAPTVPTAPAVAAPPRDVDPPRPALARPDPSRRAVEKPAAAGVGAPAVPERPATAAELASLYVAVGRQLKALGDERGPDAATELWTLYTRIRIDDAFTDPVKRAEVDALLRQLHGQIVERSR